MRLIECYSVCSQGVEEGRGEGGNNNQSMDGDETPDIDRGAVIMQTYSIQKQE